MKIYLDVCCLNRVFEESDQERMRAERAAIESIFESDALLVTSEVAREEIAATPDPELRSALDALDREGEERMVLTEHIIARGAVLEGFGFRAFDALHLACAEAAEADVFLTTDDRLLKMARRHHAHVKVRVENPTSRPL